MRGSENVFMNHLLRLENVNEKIGVNIKEFFSNEHLLKVVVKLPQFADFVNFHVYNFIWLDLTFQQKEKLALDVKGYIWDDSYLYKRCFKQIVRRCVLEDDILQHCH